MLEALGYRAQFAETGTQAIEAFASDLFHAVLMDVQIPGLDGIEVTKRIRAMESNVRVPIIALTANAMLGDRERCLAAGMDDFLSKPFKKAELAAKLPNVAHR